MGDEAVEAETPGGDQFVDGDEVRRLAAPFYEMDRSKGGQPGIDPEVYFKMLMIGFFENLASERAIAARCADSLSNSSPRYATWTAASIPPTSRSLWRCSPVEAP